MVKFAPKGWQKWLDLYTRQAATVHLFTGEGVTPEALPEVSGGGYQPHQLLGARWEPTVWGPMVRSSYPEVIFRFTGPINGHAITGYCVRDAAGDVLWWERFAEPPFEVRRNGDLVGVDITLEIDTEN